jgi:hypothetical protein
MRGVLIAIRDYNARNNNAIKSVAVPGFGTAIGRMPPSRCAYRMRMAYDQSLAAGHLVLKVCSELGNTMTPCAEDRFTGSPIPWSARNRLSNMLQNISPPKSGEA